MLLSPLATGTAHSARMYALLGFLSAFSSFFFAKIFLQNDRRRFIFWLGVLFNVLSTLTHIWFFFLLAAQALAYLILFYPKQRTDALRLFTFSVLPFAIIWTPILFAQLQNAATDWLKRPGLSELWTVFLGFYGERLALIVYALLFTLLLASLLFQTQRQKDFAHFLKDRRTLFLIIVCTASILIPFVISQFKSVFGQTRYTIIALPAVALLLAGLVEKFVKPAFLLVSCFLLLAVVVVAFVRYHSQPEPCSDKNMTAHLLENMAEGDVLVFTSLSRTATEYYLKQHSAEEKFIRFTFPSEFDVHPGWRNEEKMLAHRTLLEQEAENLTENLKQLSTEKPRRIWLFYGLDLKVSDILKQKLDANFLFEKEYDASCADAVGKPSELFYKKILVYSYKQSKQFLK